LEFLGTENPLLVQAGLACQENASQVNLEILLRETCDARAHFLMDLSNECRRLQ